MQTPTEHWLLMHWVELIKGNESAQKVGCESSSKGRGYPKALRWLLVGSQLRAIGACSSQHSSALD